MYIKKSMLSLVVATCVIGSILTSCKSSSEKVENARTKVEEAEADTTKTNQNIVDAHENLNQVQKDSAMEFEQFKQISAEKIANNEKRIAALKIQVAQEGKDIKAKYEKKVAELEQKNINMKSNIDTYKEDGKDKWKLFKRSFNQDMDMLDKSLQDVIKNTKERI